MDGTCRSWYAASFGPAAISANISNYPSCRRLQGSQSTTRRRSARPRRCFRLCGVTVRQRTGLACYVSDVFIRTLQLERLPGALEALERPLGLPPSLLGKADRVRSEDGPNRMRALLEHVRQLAEADATALDEVWARSRMCPRDDKSLGVRYA